MNIVFGILLTILGGFLLLFNKRFSQMSFALQKSLGGPIEGRTAKVFRGYVRVLGVALPVVMVLLGVGLIAGMLT